MSVFGPTLDANELSPCSLMDMNGDGIDELFWRGTEELILVSASGNVLNTESVMTGETLSFPIIADVDADGSTDLLLPTSAPDLTTVGGIQSHSHSAFAWPSGLPTWFGSAHRPVSETMAFPHFRGQPTDTVGAYDWTLQLLDSCPAACSFDRLGFVRLQVQNRGFVESPAAVLNVSWNDGFQSVPIDSFEVDELLPGALQTFELELAGMQLIGVS